MHARYNDGYDSYDYERRYDRGYRQSFRNSEGRDGTASKVLLILLAIIWTGALLGIAFRIFWLKAPRILYVALYIALGWAAMLYIVDLVNANVAMMVLVVVGGVSYTVGAVFYALKRPNPVPGVFGFHEIFHSCTVIAFLCHWTAILLIVLNPVTS